MYIVGATNQRIYQYTLSTAWDISTAVYDSNNILISAQDATPRGIFFKDDGTQFYVTGETNEKVYQYSL